MRLKDIITEVTDRQAERDAHFWRKENLTWLTRTIEDDHTGVGDILDKIKKMDDNSWPYNPEFWDTLEDIEASMIEEMPDYELWTFRNRNGKQVYVHNDNLKAFTDMLRNNKVVEAFKRFVSTWDEVLGGKWGSDPQRGSSFAKRKAHFDAGGYDDDDLTYHTGGEAFR